MVDESASASLKDELDATKAVLDALAGLPRESASRVVAGVATLLGSGGHSPPRIARPGGGVAGSGAVSHGSGDARFGHDDLASFFGAAQAEDGPAQAMVVAYWKQAVEGQDGWSGAEINSALNHMGRRLPNVTATMNLLINRKPACVLQVKKSGNSQQARKLYKLSTVGIAAVKEMMVTSGE